MKAVIITEPGGPEVLQLEERPVPSIKDYEVLVKVKAAGVNRPDIFQRKGNYPPPSGVPADIPGLEIAGVVEQCGSSVTRWVAGDKVCALLGGGGYAEFVTVAADHCLPIPEDFTFTEAAALPETIFTVWHNVFQLGHLAAGETFLVHGGSSGIGTTAIQMATIFGARVFTTAGSHEKCASCLSLGAERCVNYRDADFEETLRGEGVDVILDMVGGDYISKNLRLLNPGGRLVFINAMKGGKAEVDMYEIMRRRLTITGSTLRPRDRAFKAMLAADIEKNVWPMIRTGKFKPLIYRTFPLKQADEAHFLMESSSHIGKIVLTV